MVDPGVQIVDKSADGDLVLALVVEGQPRARAHATADVLEQMELQLGMTREGVAQELRSALERFHADALDKVTIDRVREDGDGSRRYVASYLLRDFRDVTPGVVWYDLLRGETGPETAPALVRNKLRYAVHARLVGEDAAAEELRKALQ